MGHCISIFVMRKSELRTDKINSVISDEISDDIKWTELNSEFIATTYIPNIKEFGKDKSKIRDYKLEEIFSITRDFID